jgi:hypothetical protein
VPLKKGLMVILSFAIPGEVFVNEMFLIVDVSNSLKKKNTAGA